MSLKTNNTNTSLQRRQQVMSGIDRIAGRDELAFLTTQRVSKESKISDGVLFRYFSSKEAMLSAWLETRGEELRLLMESMPASRDGLLYFLRNLMDKKPLLNFLCCLPMDIPYLRQSLEARRLQVRLVLQTRIGLLSSAPIGLDSELLTDHLMQSIYRAWNPNNQQNEIQNKIQKELLMNQLPWEKNDPNQTLLPALDVIKRLALNDSGFVFDPVSGRSFTANDIGLYVLQFLQQHHDEEALYAAVAKDFDVSCTEAERDLTEFFAQLRKFLT